MSRFTRNEGQMDRIARIVLGLAIIIIGLIAGSWLGVIGLIPLATGLIGWCPLYTLFGFSTRPAKKPQA